MPTLYMMRGLPASGKSTKRAEMLQDAKLQPIVAINKDEIRQAMNIRPGDFSKEKEVLAAEKKRLIEALHAGTNIIVDNTHNGPKYRAMYETIAREFDYTFELIDFSHVPVEECIRRDALREKPVTEAVIMRMYNQFYVPGGNGSGKKNKKDKGTAVKDSFAIPAKIIVPIIQDPTKRRIAIVDLDGTLAFSTNRSWYEYTKCGSDTLNVPVHTTIWALRETGAVDIIIFLTGREDIGRAEAEEWLGRVAGFPIDGVTNILLMKKAGDHRADTITKRELFDANILGKFYVLMVFEDRTRVVEMWRAMGLTVFQVAREDN